MKITICGSVKFAPQLVDIYRKLEKLGHQPMMHEQMFGLADGTAAQLVDMAHGTENCDIKRKYNYIKFWHGLIQSGDAILVCNFDKNGIKNYIGGNTLMEIGFAHVLNKRIFLFNPIPSIDYYQSEIEAVKPTIIHGNLSLIK